VLKWSLLYFVEVVFIFVERRNKKYKQTNNTCVVFLCGFLTFSAWYNFMSLLAIMIQF